MRPPLKLSSPQNPTVKATAELLAKRRTRDERGVFVVEGAREIERALIGGWTLTQLFTCPELQTEATAGVLTKARSLDDIDRFEVTEGVFAKLAVREGSDGLLAVFAQRVLTLGDLQLGARPLVLALHGIEKPGNLGALLRTADGVGVDAVVLLDDMVDLYNPRVVRGSVGALFGLNVACASSADFGAFCRELGIRVVAAALTPDAKPHYDADYTGAAAILLGSEANGLPPAWIREADTCAMIPMQGLADSLNVSVAGAVLLYEALRQRRLN